ncbi:MAG: 2-oxoglutarate dehydrogenase complex dihydrolipoyllysine-residue succinyltransferase [Gemmataceae bacterium]
MAIDIKVPSVGESVSEGVLSRWLVKSGDSVRAKQPLFELETDKASQEIPAPANGTVELLVKEGEKVPVGAVVARLNEGAAPTPAAPSAGPVPSPGVSSGPSLSPSAQKMAAEQHVDPSIIAGTGRGGRIIKEDIAAAVAQREKPEAVPAPKPAVANPPSVPANLPVPSAQGARMESRTRMTAIRQRIAERLLAAQQNAAILTTINEADMSAIMALRTRYKDSFQKRHGVSLGFMSFFVKAVVEAVRAFPAVNSRIDGNEIVQPHFVDIGVAVSTEKGLMVPVLRDADKLAFAQIEKGIAELAVRARDGKISVADLQGGTFTITNGGVFGSLLSTPILNPPQSGILGMHTIQKRPVAVDDQVVIRPMMYLALSYDHRIIDGREAVGFLVRVKECLENPERLMLEV